MVGNNTLVDGQCFLSASSTSEAQGDGERAAGGTLEATAADGSAASDLVAKLLALAEHSRNPARCRYCDVTALTRWGVTPKGRQRWKCRGCGRSFCTTTGTALARIRSLDKLALVVLDMLSAAPRSCRKLAAELEVERMTIWRWRLLIARAMAALQENPPHDAAETARLEIRESRKASREWVDHQREPARHPASDRLRWIDYRLRRLPLPEPMARFLVPIRIDLSTAGQCCARILDAMPDPAERGDAGDRAAVGPSLQETGATTKCSRSSGRPPCNRPAGYVHSVTDDPASASLAAGLRRFLAPFSGPATKHLSAYLAWFSRRRDAGTLEPLERIWRQLLA